MTPAGRPIAVSLITVLFVFICLTLFFKLFGPIPFFVQNVTTTKESLFTAEGTGEVAIIPDTALISFGVNKTANTVEQAKNEVNEISNKITEDLKKLGVDVKNIKTTNYSVNPQYDYSRGGQRITGYTVDTNIQVKLQPIDKANDAVDIATKDGANQVGGVQFVVDDKKQKELENEARKLAIEDAKEKAKSIADAAGIKLGRIVDVRVNPINNYAPMPVMRDLAMGSAEKAQETQLNPGENKIMMTVSLSYETY